MAISFTMAPISLTIDSLTTATVIGAILCATTHGNGWKWFAKNQFEKDGMFLTLVGNIISCV